ncbi:MAG: ABC transporter ATP-binding protein [Phycisphaerales bacterium]
MLRVREVSFSYPGHSATPRRVLEGVSLEVSSGVTAVIGPNGSGKSTLLRLMLGVLRPSFGEVLWGDSPTSRGAGAGAGVAAHRLGAAGLARRCAYIPQRGDVSAAFTVREVVGLGRFALTPSDEAVFRALDRMDVLDRRDEPFAHLSAGQQQRVVAARALAQLDPGKGKPGPGSLGGKVLLADEPFSALDPAHVEVMVSALRESASLGAGVVVVLHDLTTAARMADRVLVLDSSGKVAALGTPDEAMSSETLKRVFGVGFERLQGSGGVVIARGGSLLCH